MPRMSFEESWKFLRETTNLAVKIIFSLLNSRLPDLTRRKVGWTFTSALIFPTTGKKINPNSRKFGNWKTLPCPAYFYVAAAFIKSLFVILRW